jgi:hypothetical protein
MPGIGNHRSSFWCAATEMPPRQLLAASPEKSAQDTRIVARRITWEQRVGSFLRRAQPQWLILLI